MAKQYKLPWIKFWTRAWKEKTRKLSGEARGVWIDLICEMWEQPRRGTITVSIESLARMLILPEKVVKKSVEEIINLGICDSDLKIPVVINTKNQFFTLRSRRIVRDERRRKSDAVRKTESKVYNKLRKDSEPVPQTIQSDSTNNPSQEKIRRIEDKKIEEDNTNTTTTEYYEKAKEYLLSTSVAHNIVFETEGLTAENYPGYVEQFISRQRKVSKTWPKFQEMQAHFCNWLDKKNLKPKTEKIMIR